MPYGDEDYSYNLVKAATPKANGQYYIVCASCYGNREDFTIYSPKTIKFTQSSYVYNGKAQKPKVKVYDSKGNLISNKYYKVKYGSGRKYPGKYTVTVEFGHNNADKDYVPYKGSIKTSFTIIPKPTKITSITAKKAGFKIKIKSMKTQTSGYQIRYAKSEDMKKAKSKFISLKKSSFTVSKLTRKCTYYVQIRTYKTVKKKKIYSNWSGVLSEQTK